MEKMDFQEVTFSLISSFGVRDLNSVNLGFGDSGSPALDKFGDIIGVNSDGFCPLGDRACGKGNNSEFARLKDQSGWGIWQWIVSALNGESKVFSSLMV